MSRRIQSGNTMPERMENHAKKSWFDLSFNHKTTLSMGMLVPLATKETYPGETWQLSNEVKMMFAQLYLPIFHQCYFTVDWYFVSNTTLWDNTKIDSWENFIKQDPIATSLYTPTYWSWFNYKRADAVETSGVLNYMGFNAPPVGGTLIASTPVSALPVAAYVKIWDEYYRNDQIQESRFGVGFESCSTGDITAKVEHWLPNMLCLRRNWPRDYFTSATPTPQQGANVLIPSAASDGAGGWVPQKLFNAAGGGVPTTGGLSISTSGTLQKSTLNTEVILQLSSTIRDLRYSVVMTEYLERSLRAGDRYVDFVQRNFGYNPNPLYIDRPVWIGGYTGDIFIQEVLATAEAGDYTVGQYTGQALARDNTPSFVYTTPDYGFVMCLLTVYPKASYYQGIDNMWTRWNKMKYMWEQFALIGDQPINNSEVWFSWYDADIAWNTGIFGYLPQYTQHKYSNDIVSGQMRTIWESFHLGRKFEAAADVVLNSDFITCTPDIGRVFNVDYEAGEHEVFVHAYNSMKVLRRLPKNALPQL